MTPRRSAATRILHIIAGIVVCTAVAALGIVALLTALFSTTSGYDDSTRTGADEIATLTDAATGLITMSTVLFAALLALALIAIVAALKRRMPWVVLTGTCALLLLFAQLAVLGANTRLEEIAARATMLADAPTPSTPAAPPSDPPAEPITVDDARAELTRMLTATFEASVSPVVTGDGAPATADSISPVASPCGDAGTRLTASVEFRTDDNAASLAAILTSWDDAGYAPDRAIQEDLRYSTTLPIARMSIRDRSTIDGLLHMEIESTCAVTP